MYDWAHGLEDSIERITHSLCSLEFEDHRPLYDWFLDSLNVYRPQQIEFARLNLNYTVMSKRKLKKLGAFFGVPQLFLTSKEIQNGNVNYYQSSDKKRGRA